MYLNIICNLLCSSLIVLNVTYIIWSLTCLSLSRLPSNHTIVDYFDYLYGLYASVARQQGTTLICAFTYSVLGQVCYFNISLPDLCIFVSFRNTVLEHGIYLMI